MTKNPLTVADCLDAYHQIIGEICKCLPAGLLAPIRQMVSSEYNPVFQQRIQVDTSHPREIVFTLNSEAIYQVVKLFQPETQVESLHLLATAEVLTAFRQCLNENWLNDDPRFMRKASLPPELIASDHNLSERINTFQQRQIAVSEAPSPFVLRRSMDLILFSWAINLALKHGNGLLKNHSLLVALVTGKVPIQFDYAPAPVLLLEGTWTS